MKKENNCNCPMCSKTEMKQGEVYFCKKDHAIMGVCDIDTTNIPLTSVKKVFMDYYDNEKNN